MELQKLQLYQNELLFTIPETAYSSFIYHTINTTKVGKMETQSPIISKNLFEIISDNESEFTIRCQDDYAYKQ